jgi:TRAP-type transport system small permease protein
MELLARLDRAAIRWLQILALIGFTGIMAGSAIITVDALLRSFASRPIRGLSEIIDVSTAIVIATSFPIGLAQRRNIRIQFLGEFLGRLGSGLLELFCDSLLLIFVTIVSVQLIQHAIEVTRLGESSLVLQIPASPFWIAASAILSLSVPAQALVTTSTFAQLFVDSPRKP